MGENLRQTASETESSSEEEEAPNATEVLKPPLMPKPAPVSETPETVSWEGPRVNFQVLKEILPMRLEREPATPSDVLRIWESWGLKYVGRVRFEAPPEMDKRWLNPREDTLPLHPAVVVLHERSGS